MTYRRSKYGARKTTIDNIVFDSAAESRRYQDLKLMVAAGEITKLDVHPAYPLTIWTAEGSLHTICQYEADFGYMRDGKAVTEDVKGMRTGPAWSLFRLKAKLFAALYGREIEVYPPPPPRAPRRKAKR